MSEAAHSRPYPIHEDAPRVGFYRMRRFKNGPFIPVVIWQHDGAMVCRVGPDMADPHETWLHCADKPVSQADAKHAFDTGRWPGDAPAPIGDNSPPSDDPFEAIQRELEAEAIRVEAWVKEPHEGKTKAEMAANWLGNLRRLEAKTVEAFNTEKAPALAESKRIDEKWRGLKATADKIKRLMDECYQAIGRKEKARLQAIADAKAKQEAEERRKAMEAERERMAALAAEHNIPVDLAPLPEPTLPIAAPVKVAFGGAQGPRISVRKVPPTAVVEDWAKAAVHYSTHARVREVIAKLATHDAKDGRLDIPGVKIIQGE